MRGLMLFTVLGLAACVGTVPKTPALRNPDTQIASAALFDPARFADVWHVVAAYGDETVCGPLAETWARKTPDGFEVTGTACGPNGARAFAGKAVLTGPGRITRAGLNGTEELWVLWVDQDYRVAVIGTPDGRFGRILSRSPEIRPDLLNAAREVLDFNGYDVSRLKMI